MYDGFNVMFLCSVHHFFSALPYTFLLYIVASWVATPAENTSRVIYPPCNTWILWMLRVMRKLRYCGMNMTFEYQRTLAECTKECMASFYSAKADFIEGTGWVSTSDR